jgi:hypothetical protein
MEYRFVPAGACGTCTGMARSLDYEVHERKKEKEKNGIMEKLFSRKNEFSLDDRTLWRL